MGEKAFSYSSAEIWNLIAYWNWLWYWYWLIQEALYKLTLNSKQDFL